MDAAHRLVALMHADGFPPRAIAKTSGLSASEVFNALRALGVSKKATNLPTVLSTWEEAILLGSMLGDGHMRYRREGHGAPHLSFSHAEKQREWLVWKIEQLGDLFFEPPLKSYVDGDGHRSIHATSRCSPLLAPLYAAFYPHGHDKAITAAVLDRVAAHDYTELILAVWFGDDGYRSSGNGKSVGLVLGKLGSEEDYERVRDWLAARGFDGTLHPHLKRESYRYLLLHVAAAHRFRDAVGPYLHTSMQYKLDIGPPRKIRRSRASREV